jgi:hypothetical protein
MTTATLVAKAPDYSKWCERRLWTIHESVCLMLAMEPEIARHDSGAGLGGFNPVEQAIEQYADFADEAMRSGALQPFSPEDLARPALQRRVDPRAFLRCAKTWNIPIPDGLMPVLAREPTRPPVVPSSVLEQLGRGYFGADYIEEAREQVLGAAIAALKAYPERCVSAAAVRRIIENNASLLWPDTCRPPLTAMEMERLIGRWLDRLG